MLEAINSTNKKSNYHPQLLSTKELIDKYWGQCKPLIEQCINRQMHGEMELDDIYTRTLKGEMYIIAFKNDVPEIPDVKLALVLELHYYPRFTAMNIVALGGRDLKAMIDEFWPHVCGWAKICGVKKIECSVPLAMERILKNVGFKQHYIQMRQEL